MDSEITGTVLSAAPRIVGNNKTIYDIAFSDGNTYTTFDTKLWAKVQEVGQQPASARVAIKPNPQKPQFTNFYLNDIAPQGQLPPPGVEPHSAPPQVTAPTVPQAAFRAPQSGGMSAEDKARVTWLSCLSSAAHGFVAGLDKDEVLGIAVSFYEITARGGYKAPEREPVATSAADNGTGDEIPW